MATEKRQDQVLRRWSFSKVRSTSVCSKVIKAVLREYDDLPYGLWTPVYTGKVIRRKAVAA